MCQIAAQQLLPPELAKEQAAVSICWAISNAFHV
jgi:hypothetical protein